LVCSQIYSATKEIFDIAKVYPFPKAYPFANSSLVVLAIDPSLHEIWEHADGYRGKAWSARNARQVYVAVRARLPEGIQYARLRSIGAREEHCVSMILFLPIGNRLEERKITDIPLVLTSPHLRFYAAPTSSIIDYFHSIIVMFAFGFAYSIIRDGGTVISLESSQMALIFLDCLRVSSRAALVSRQSGLCIDIGRDNEVQEPREGMWLKNPIVTSGYAFFVPDKVYWGSWKFHSQLTNKILFVVWQLQNSYSKCY